MIIQKLETHPELKEVRNDGTIGTQRNEGLLFIPETADEIGELYRYAKTWLEKEEE